MKNQNKGIATILFGILLGVIALSINVAELSIIGGVVGIIGLIIVFLNKE